VGVQTQFTQLCGNTVFGHRTVFPLAVILSVIHRMAARVKASPDINTTFAGSKELKSEPDTIYIGSDLRSDRPRAVFR